MSTITAASSLSTPTVSSRVEAVPWLVWANVIASICISAGLYWDISWHETIGRDSFWTPAHLLIQFGAVLGAFGSAWVIMRTTFGGDSEERPSTGGQVTGRRRSSTVPPARADRPALRRR